MLYIHKNPDGVYTKNMPGLAAPSREDEEKHQRLSADNVEIKRQIAEVSYVGHLEIKRQIAEVSYYANLEFKNSNCRSKLFWPFRNQKTICRSK